MASFLDGISGLNRVMCGPISETAGQLGDMYAEIPHRLRMLARSRGRRCRRSPAPCTACVPASPSRQDADRKIADRKIAHWEDADRKSTLSHEGLKPYQTLPTKALIASADFSLRPPSSSACLDRDQKVCHEGARYSFETSDRDIGLFRGLSAYSNGQCSGICLAKRSIADSTKTFSSKA